jgi:hypothetical protein
MAFKKIRGNPTVGAWRQITWINPLTDLVCMSLNLFGGCRLQKIGLVFGPAFGVNHEGLLFLVLVFLFGDI